MRKLLAALALLAATPAFAADDPPAWREPAGPFRIVGNIFYVGSKGLAAYLIPTPDGAILIDGTVEDNVAMIERNIDTLKYRMRDVKILLNSHAHFDHAEGLAHLKRDSGAQMVAIAQERAGLESGIPPSEMSYGVIKFAPVKVDRVIKDGDTVRVGRTVLKAVLTPGHTPGCTSWSMTVTDRGRPLNVLFLCSLTVAGSKLIGNTGYPHIVADFRKTFARLDKMHADVVLPFHPELTDIWGRAARAQTGDANAFVDPGELRTIVAKARSDFEGELAKAGGR
jgi:metallo-beta-lactamase class B